MPLIQSSHIHKLIYWYIYWFIFWGALGSCFTAPGNQIIHQCFQPGKQYDTCFWLCGENRSIPRRREENMLTLHRKAFPIWERNPGTSFCFVTVLTTTPQCRVNMISHTHTHTLLFPLCSVEHLHHAIQHSNVPPTVLTAPTHRMEGHNR